MLPTDLVDLLDGANDGSDSENDDMTIAGRLPAVSREPFYAYIKSKTVVLESDERVIITFASRSIADEWWRGVSTIAKLRNSVKRITPQFYTVDENDFRSAMEFFSHSDELKHIFSPFMDTMFFSHHSIAPIIPKQPIVDHLSGHWFFIRSITTQNECWCFTALGQGLGITTHAKERTLFRISGLGLSNGTIMVGNDDIKIFARNHGYLKWYPAASSFLVETEKSEATIFKFSDLESGKFEQVHNVVMLNTNTGEPVGWQLAI